jgi:hypothetical protein
VDNASFDGCGEKLSQEYPSVIFLQSQYNLGFARANNFGAKHARGGVLLFLNPDTEVQKGAINFLYEEVRRLQEAGVVGCRLLNSDGSVQTSCVQAIPTVLNQLFNAEVLRRWFPKFRFWGISALSESGKVPVQVEAVSGACMMIRREVFNLVGGFSSDFFMYCEDLDLCYKTQRAGFTNFHLGNAVIIHHGGGSSGQERSNFSNVMICESVYRFLRKSRGVLYGDIYRIALCSAAIIRIGLIVLLFPVYSQLRRSQNSIASLLKWVAILRWVVGLESWSRKYYHGISVSPKDKKVKTCVGSAGN